MEIAPTHPTAKPLSMLSRQELVCDGQESAIGWSSFKYGQQPRRESPRKFRQLWPVPKPPLLRHEQPSNRQEIASTGRSYRYETSPNNNNQTQRESASVQPSEKSLLLFGSQEFFFRDSKDKVGKKFPNQLLRQSIELRKACYRRILHGQNNWSRHIWESRLIDYGPQPSKNRQINAGGHDWQFLQLVVLWVCAHTSKWSEAFKKERGWCSKGRVNSRRFNRNKGSLSSSLEITWLQSFRESQYFKALLMGLNKRETGQVSRHQDEFQRF